MAGVMRNHRSQPPRRPAPLSRSRISNSAAMHGGAQALRDLFFRQATQFYFCDGGVMIVDASPVSSAPEETPQTGAQALRDIFIRQSTPFYFCDDGVMVVDARPVSSAAEETPQTVNGLSKEVISRFLETTIYENPAAVDGGGDPEVCAVCLDLCREKQSVGVLRCRHRFHADCIGKWLQNKNVCPLCNAIGIEIL